MTPTRSILLVDDSEAELELMEHYLEPLSRELRIESARNGRDAVAFVASAGAAARARLALVVIDYRMPLMDGVEATRAIRSAVPAPLLPIVMWSGSVDPGDVRRAYDAGVSSYLRKPSSSAEARAALTTAVGYWTQLLCPAA